MHRACCNYAELRDYAGRVVSGPKHCPLATCRARLQRTRDVERDSTLRAWLAQVAPDASAIWLRGDEMRHEAPPSLQSKPEGRSRVSLGKGSPKRGSQRKRGPTTTANGKVAPRRSSSRRIVISL